MSAAPEDVIIAFLNTIDVEEQTDVMDDLGNWREWVNANVAAAAGDAETLRSLRAALELRTHLRSVAIGETPGTELRIPVEVELVGRDARLSATTPAAQVAAAAARLVIEGRWQRVKICPADDCLWAFYDRSKNQSRHWCSMQVCGNRTKARNHRERQRT